RVGGVFPRARDDAGGRVHLLRRAPAAQRRPPLGTAHLPLLARLPGTALRRDAARPHRLVEIRTWTARQQDRASPPASWPAASRQPSSPSASWQRSSTSPH